MSNCSHCSAKLADPAPAVCSRCGGRIVSPSISATVDAPSDKPNEQTTGYVTIELEELGEALESFIHDELAAADDSFSMREPAPTYGEDPSATRDHDPSSTSEQRRTATHDPNAARASDPSAARRPLTDSQKQQARRVSQLWGSSVKPGDKPRNSLKGSDGDDPGASYGPEISSANLIIHRRRLARGPAAGGTPLDYELLDVLGEGGMGVVYSARQTAVDRTIALKMLKTKTANTPLARTKFLAEAAVTSDLDHPNIVPIHDLGQNEEGALFYAMKRVKGQPWLDVLKEKTEAENIKILLSVADAVAFSHDHGVIHRDLKPENVMLGDYGEVLVMDWGLAVGVDAKSKASAFTKVDSIGGTPTYMAPEMAGGPLSKVGKHSDIYLLGGMLWEIITGNTPHTGSTVMACLMAAAVNALTPTTKRGELVNIALKAMAVEPSDRYPTVQAFQNAIRAYQDHRESIVLADDAQKTLDLAKSTKKYDDYSRAAFSFEQALKRWTENQTAREGRSTAQRMFAATALENNDLDLADSLLDEHDETHQHLIPQVAAAREVRLRNQRNLAYRTKAMWTSLAAIFIGGSAALYFINNERIKADVAQQEATKQKGIAEGNAATARRQEAEATRQARIAAANAAAEKAAAERADQNAKKAEENAIAATAAKVLADKNAEEAKRQTLIAESEGYLAKVGLAAAKIDQNSFRQSLVLLNECKDELRQWEWGRIKYLTKRDDGSFDHNGPVTGAAYGPSASTVVTGSLDGSAVLWDVATKQPLRTFPHGQPIWSIALSTDGARLATGGGDGVTKIWDATSGALLHELTAHRDAVLSLAFTQDAARLASASRDDTAIVWDVKTGKPLLGLGGGDYGHDLEVWSVAWAPDENVIATAGEDGRVLMWRVDRPLFEDEHAVYNVKPLDPKSPLTGIPRSQKLGEYKGHGGGVSKAVFARDGRFVVSAGFDKAIHVWYAGIECGRTAFTPMALFGTLSHKIEGHLNRVWSLRISPDSTTVLSGGDDNLVRTWTLAWGATSRELPNGRIEPNFPTCLGATPGPSFRGHSARIRSLDLSDADPRPLSASDDGSAKLWREGRFREYNPFPTTEVVDVAALSSDEKTVLAGCEDRAVRVLDVRNQDVLAVLDEGGKDAITSIDATADGKRLLGADATGQVTVWDSATRAELLSFQAHEGRARENYPCLARFSRNGKWIVTGGADNLVRLWDASNGKLLREYTAHSLPVSAVAFSPDNKYLVSGDTKGNLFLHDFEGKVPSRSSNRATSDPNTPAGPRPGPGVAAAPVAPQPTAPSGAGVIQHGHKIISDIHVFSNGLVASACEDASVGLWNIADFSERGSLQHRLDDAGAAVCEVRCMDLSPDETKLLTGDSQGIVRLWDVKNAALLQTFRGHDGDVFDVAFTPDGKHALSTGLDRSMIAWDLENPAVHKRTPASGYRVTTLLRFTDDGRNLLTADEDAVTWRKVDGTIIFNIVRHSVVEGVAYSIDGKQAITAGADSCVKVWDLASRRVVARLSETHRGVLRDMAVWPQASTPGADSTKLLVATVGADRTVRLWDGRQQTLVREFTGHRLAVNGVAFFPDGTRLVSGSSDGTVRIWNAVDGAALLKLPLAEEKNASHEGAITSVAVSPDGGYIVTAGEDQAICVWEGATGRQLHKLTGHTADVTSLRFASNEARLASTSVDASVKIWDHVRGKEVLTLVGHEQETTDICFLLKNGLSVLSFGKDRSAIQWPAEPWTEAKPAAAARASEPLENVVRIGVRKSD